MLVRVSIAFFLITSLVCGPAIAQWSTYQGNANHDGYVPITLNPSKLALLWQRGFATSRLNPVAEGNGEVYASVSGYFSSGMSMEALDATTGNTKWSVGFGSPFSVNPPAYANGRVYIQTCNHSSDTHLWCYDASTGAQLFNAPFAAQWENYYAPTIYDGTVYINGGYYGGMYAFDSTTGQQKWFIGLSQYDNWTPAVDANYAYGYAGSTVTAVDRASGQSVFQISDATIAGVAYDMNQALALGPNSDAFVVANGRLSCLDLKNRNIKWQLARAFGGNGQATIANGVVYAIDNGKVDAVDELSGTLLWSWAAPTGSAYGPVIATKGHLLASTSNATYAIDLNTHASVWSYPLGGRLALSDRALYITGSDGTLSAISVPPSSIFPVEPSSLSLSILNPTTNPVTITTSRSINISGTASEIDVSGTVLGTGHLTSVRWSNDRGGSGTGSYGSTWNAPTTWSATGVVLSPGDNVVTVTASDLWGNSATSTTTVKAPSGLSLAISSPTSQPTYLTSSTPISLSGTANELDPSGSVLSSGTLASVSWSSNRGGSGAGTYVNSPTQPTTWSVTGISVQPGDNIITVTATDVFGNTGSSVITVTAPTGLAAAITKPTSGSASVTSTSAITLSGTANSIAPGGVTLPTAGLASVTWSNSRGGSGTGTFSTASTSPTTWSASGIAVLPGDNVIRVTATDLWGNTASASITITAPTGLALAIVSPTSNPTYTTYGSPIALSGTAAGIYSPGETQGGIGLASVRWTNDRGSSGTGSFSNPSTSPATWSIASIPLQGGDNTISVTATDVFGHTAASSIAITWAPGPIGAAKRLPAGTLVYIEDAVVTATTIPSAGVFVESSDRSSGVRLVTSQPLNVGDAVVFTGSANRINGEYQITGVSFSSISPATPLRPLFMTSRTIGNDRMEMLAYSGIDTTGLLVRMCGYVTAVLPLSNVVYVSDGSPYADGVGPFDGIRVRVPSTVQFPAEGDYVAVTGISRVEKLSLTQTWTEVNDYWYPVGTTVYVPSVWARSASDIQVLPPEY